MTAEEDQGCRKTNKKRRRDDRAINCQLTVIIQEISIE